MALTATHNETKFSVGDMVRVHQRFFVGDKAQTQIFEGLVIAIKNRGDGKSITLRKIGADGVGIEKIWPLSNPNLTKITVKKAGKVKRSKLYYLRQRGGKLALATKAS
jgi:large subunit ribosomal protein L19